MLSWIDPDAFLNQPDADNARLLQTLPVHVRRGSKDDGRAPEEARQLALVAAVEHDIPEMMHICDDCHFNGGVLLLNPDHPLLLKLLDEWWDSPFSGTCEPRFLRERLAEQACLDQLVVYNHTTSTRFRRAVGEADFVSLNSPNGRLVRHPWGHHRDNSDNPDGVYSVRLRSVGLWHPGAASALAKELKQLLLPWPEDALR